MKITLSMPSTISIAVSVIRLSQVAGWVRNSIVPLSRNHAAVTGSPTSFDVFDRGGLARSETRHLAAIGLEHDSIGGIRPGDREVVSTGHVLCAV